MKNTSEEFGHLMLDIETMGTVSYSAILSIAAVEFDIETGATGREFYTVINLKSCLDHGLKITAETFYWWMEQSHEARQRVFAGNKVSLVAALSRLIDFIGDAEYQVWGNSASFDCQLIENACEKAGFNLPWKFSKERDVRTLVSFAPGLKKGFPRTGVAHDALADCYHQIGYCTEIWNRLSPRDSFEPKTP